MSVFIIVLFTIMFCVNKYFGWYAYEKYDLRRYSSCMVESKNRKVFIKKLNYSVSPDSINFDNLNFYIEKGYKWGKHSSTQTNIIKNTNYLYQISFKIKNNEYQLNFSNIIDCDSCVINTYFLKERYLNDTLEIDVFKQKKTQIINFDSVGKIKIWDDSGNGLD